MQNSRCRILPTQCPSLTAVGLLLMACTANDSPTGSSADAPALARSAVGAYTFVDLGTLDGCCSRATGINAKGQVVGESEVPFRDDGGPGEDRGTHAFLWEDGVMTDLNVGDFNGASGINNSGTVVFSAGRFDEGAAFLWRNGVTTQLKGLGGPLDGASAINSSGQVVGTSSPGFGSQTFHAVIWDKSGAVTDLGSLGGSFAMSEGHGINDAGQAVGLTTTPSALNHAFLWSKGVMTDLGTLGGNYSFATGINSKGTVVGCSALGGGVPGTHAFSWNDGQMTDLGTLGGQDSCAGGVDDAGRVVGFAAPSTGVGHAVIWDHGAITDLGVLAGEGGSAATAINAKGTVVGYFYPLPEVGAAHAAMWIRR
jgi:probable HAF family extracellular repeat protein